MITLIFSPRWFFGYDIIFELLGVIVTLLISVHSHRLYRFSKDYTYKFLSLSFFAISASFLAKIATNFALYYQQTVKTAFQELIVKHNLLDKSNLFLQAGYDAHRFLMLLGLFGIYWLVSKSKDYEHQWLFGYLILVVALFSFSTYYVFHITAAFILFFIARHYHRRCFGKERAAPVGTHLNFLAFSLLLMSQAVFIFIFLNNAIYVIAEILQLAGFIIFLVNMWLLVFRHGKTKD
ncbi:hypothetical protein JXA12_00900 [Candidatus Woesearchaeota archaeon]|nr:hypothetical protein [Candidatus Woesearchaeota archaeon]